MTTTNITKPRQMHWTDTGHGDAVFLLLHGIPGHRGNWDQVIERIRQGARVIAPDLIGFGESGEMGSLCHAECQARALVKLLDSLAVTKFHLVGFDFGGPVAVWLTRLIPDQIATLTLIATNVFTDTPIPPPLRIAKVPYLGNFAFRFMMGRFGQRMMWLPAVRNRRAFPWKTYSRVLRYSNGVRSTRLLFLQSLRYLEKFYRPIQDQLKRIVVPTTVIWGDSDPFFPSAVGRRTAEAVQTSQYVELRKCGHFVPEECPDEVAAELLLHLRGLHVKR